MTQYVINIGAIPNDGTGDPLRTAFNETNLNFDQVFAAGPVLSNIQIANNTILVTNTNGNLVLATNGVGKIQAAADVVPSVNLARNLGSSTQKWNTIYSQYITISGDATVAGNLSVAGNIIQVGNIVTDALTIQLANTAASANAANGSGITVGANDNIATILYNSTSNAWTTNIGISAVGNISAPYFIGNGSQLTGLAATYGNANVATFLAAYGSNTISTTGNITSGNLKINSTANIDVLNVNSSGNTWTISGNVLTAPSNAIWQSDPATLDEYINSAPDGYINMTSLYANANIASQLHLEHGLAQIITQDGNLSIWEFDSTGNLTLPGNTFAVNYANGTPVTFSGTYGNSNVANFLGDFGSNAISTSGNISAGNVTLTDLYSPNYYANAVTYANATGHLTNTNQFTYNPTTEVLTVSNISTTGNVTANYFIGDGSLLTNLPSGTSNSIVNGTSNVSIPTANSNVTISANTSSWTFGSDGYLTFPRDAAGATDPYLLIQGGPTPTIQSVDVSLAGPANLAMSVDYLNLSGFTGNKIVAYPDQGLLGADANLVLFADFANAGNTNSYWTFDTTGNLTTSSNLVIGPGPGGGSSVLQYDAALQILGEGANSVVQMGWTANTSAPDSVTTIAMNYPGGGEGNVLIAVGNNATTVNYWLFDNTGNLTLPGNSFAVNYANGTAVSIGGGSGNTGNVTFADVTIQGVNGLNLSAGADFTANLAYLQVRSGDQPSHIHLDTGNNFAYDLLVGDDDKFVQVGLGGNISIAAYDNGNSAQYIWNFDPTGNLTLPAGGVVRETNIPDGALSGSAIALKPAGGTTANQQLLIYPTANDGDHIHLTSGNLYSTELYFGSDDLYVKLANTGNILINSNDSAGNIAQWTFGANGNLSAPGNVSASGNVTGAYILGNGSLLTSLPAPAVTQDITSNGAMSIMLYDGNIKYNNYATVEPASGNIAGGNISATGNIAGNYIFGNVAFANGIPATYGNANVADFMANYGSNAISLTGTITTGNVFVNGEVSTTGNIIGANVTGYSFYANGIVSASGNIDAQQFHGSLFGNNSLSNLTITSNDHFQFNVGNVANVVYINDGGLTVDGGVNGFILATGNVSGGNINANGLITGANIHTGGRVSAAGEITGANLVISGNIGANIVGANTYTGGNISASGNITGGNIVTAGAGGNITLTGGNIVGANNISTGTITLTNGATIKDTAGNSVAFGLNAGQSSQGIEAVAIGDSAGNVSQGQYAVAVGFLAGSNSQGAFSVAAGYSAAFTNQANSAVAIGSFAGATSQGLNSVAVGVNAGYTSQGIQSVAVGIQAGANVQGQNSVAIGAQAGYETQGGQSVAIGVDAGKTTQGNNSVSIGTQAGNSSQGNDSVAIGTTAGFANQGIYAVAIGYQAGNTTQGNSAVAIGENAGYNTQGISAVAVGDGAGRDAQGQFAVALGYGAGNSNQANNSIILNATGSVLEQTTANTFTVAPIRNDVANTGQVVFYNTSSKEVTYGNTISVAGNVTAANFFGNGSTLSNVATQVTGSWTLAPGVNSVSFTVTPGLNYSMWVNGNIPNGIVMWNATVSLSNTNVPVVGTQYGWYYAAGNALVLTSIPPQIVGTAGSISTATFVTTTSNIFEFNITNNSGNSQVVNWGYTKIS